MPADRLLPVRPDAPEVGLDQEEVDERAAQHAVLHPIGHQRTAVRRLEAVLVDPPAVRAAQLCVDETVGRLPGGDLATPEDRYPAQSQAIVDDRPFPQDDGIGCQDLEAQEGWRERLEVMCVGEEVEDLFHRPRQSGLRLEKMAAIRSPPT